VNGTMMQQKYGECVQPNAELATWINAKQQCMEIADHPGYLANIFNKKK
jgi:hypothetical protein